MRAHRRLLSLVAVAIMTLTACAGGVAPGSSTGSQGGPTVAGASAKAAIESAAKVTLVEQADSDADGVSYANTDTMMADGQIVAVIVAKDATAVKAAAEAMKAVFATFGQLKTFTNKNVIVLYAPLGGTDNSAAVEAAVKAL